MNRVKPLGEVIIEIRRCHARIAGEGVGLIQATSLDAWGRAIEAHVCTAPPATTSVHDPVSDLVLLKAEQIARHAHRNQTEPHGSGRPYVEHLERVVARVRGCDTETRAVAWLHDVLEDCPVWHRSMLIKDGIPEVVVNAVEVVTKQPRPLNSVLGPADWYLRYIDHVTWSGNLRAIRVKRADLLDHLSHPDRCPRHLQPRYTRALAVLTEHLHERYGLCE